MTTPRLLIATKNRSKFAEFSSLFQDLSAELTSLASFPDVASGEEKGDTFEAIAVHKAKQACAATGLLTVADDSGLEIDALAGAPGIRSHRFLGEGVTDADRNQEILNRLLGVAPPERTARFRCVIAIAAPDFAKAENTLRTETVSGVCEGIIADAPRGENGFGYDPIFLLPDLGKTMAELSAEEKNQVSHRARAAQASIPILLHLLSDHFRNGWVSR